MNDELCQSRVKVWLVPRLQTALPFLKKGSSIASLMSDNPQSGLTQLKWHQRLALTLLAGLMRLWGRTLRFRWGPDVQTLIDGDFPPSVVILWHNRLFLAPLFYRRYFRARKLACLISASRDGAWFAGFVESLGMLSIRGSQGGRGAQAIRDLVAVNRTGIDVAVTPDGSRGPIYQMKGGAMSVATKARTPIVLLSLNHSRAWRLKSWDRFIIPYPFSEIEVRVDQVGPASTLGDDPKTAVAALQERLYAMTRP